MRRLRKAVDVKSLSKETGNKKILERVSFKVDRDERVVICGPSGSGKTTLLRCLNGLESYNTGSVTVLGVRISSDPKSIQDIRSKTGMLFQSFNLFPHLTILENCTLALQTARRLSSEKAIETARHYLDRVKVIDQEHKYPIALSGGQQQRVAIARALCMEPELLLFDEPTSALDPEMVSEVLDVLRDLANSGMTMICVTHEMKFAKKFADKVILMDEGKIVIESEAEAFFHNTDNPRVKAFLKTIRSR
ncbi:MAG: ABC transporter ATP-binding protein [Legionellales bacterium]|nr:ABC transporter ATP-binding protein [Legionellales bacterium]